MSLDDLVPSLLRAQPVGSPADEAAFDVYRRAVTKQFGILGSVVMLVATLGWWPLDAWVLPQGADAAAFARMRLHAAGVEVVALGVMAAIPATSRAVLPAAVLLYAALLGSMGEALGHAGTPEAPEAALPWLADAWIGILPLAFVPLRLGWRVPGTLLVAAALGGGFFAARPGNVDLPGAWAQVSFGLFAVLFSLVVGEGLLRLTRRGFFERLALDRAKSELEGLTASLSDQVAERTRTLQALTHHLDRAQEAERRRLAHDLHDDLGQQLTAMRYTVARLAGRLEAGEDAGALVADLEALLSGTTRSTRGVVTRLRPRILDDLGLVPALEWLCEDVQERTRVACALDAPPEGGPLDGLAAGVQLALFRLVQEATTNALKHAAPAHLEVGVGLDGGTVRVWVRDDGAGFDPATATSGFGLLGLRERLRGLGGTFAVRSAPGAGTTVEASVPLPRVAPEGP
ncbi:MAG: sensor histidine kinase [Alphaproteobacteria bacterium]|nr:sensor histidine kinase [Alphaproteobacteria bacterium]